MRSKPSIIRRLSCRLRRVSSPQCTNGPGGRCSRRGSSPARRCSYLSMGQAQDQNEAQCREHGDLCRRKIKCQHEPAHYVDEEKQESFAHDSLRCQVCATSYRSRRFRGATDDEAGEDAAAAELPLLDLVARGAQSPLFTRRRSVLEAYRVGPRLKMKSLIATRRCPERRGDRRSAWATYTGRRRSSSAEASGSVMGPASRAQRTP
jgi:hypothetical protein